MHLVVVFFSESDQFISAFKRIKENSCALNRLLIESVDKLKKNKFHRL